MYSTPMNEDGTFNNRSEINAISRDQEREEDGKGRKGTISMNGGPTRQGSEPTEQAATQVEREARAGRISMYGSPGALHDYEPSNVPSSPANIERSRGTRQGTINMYGAGYQGERSAHRVPASEHRGQSVASPMHKGTTKVPGLRRDRPVVRTRTHSPKLLVAELLAVGGVGLAGMIALRRRRRARTALPARHPMRGRMGHRNSQRGTLLLRS